MRIDATLISHCNNGITKVYYVGTELSAEDHRKLSIYKPKAPAIADPALFSVSLFNQSEFILWV